jgi:hypothetical protein
MVLKKKIIGGEKNPMSSIFDFVESDEDDDEQHQIRVVKRQKLIPSGLQFPQMVCPKRIRDDLSDSEILTLKQYTNLAFDWGYRSGVNNQHQRFELESGKQSLISIQKYSDVLFRSLWAIEHKSRIYIDSDIIDKLFTCEDLSNQKDISSFVSRFIKQEFDGMYDLSHIDLTSKHSPIFICIVAAARALILIATERQKHAFELFQFLSDCFL